MFPRTILVDIYFFYMEIIGNAKICVRDHELDIPKFTLVKTYSRSTFGGGSFS